MTKMSKRKKNLKDYDPSNNGRHMNFDDIFMFGQYKDSGKTAEEVAESDPDYIRYLIENSICEFDDYIENMVDK